MNIAFPQSYCSLDNPSAATKPRDVALPPETYAPATVDPTASLIYSQSHFRQLVQRFGEDARSNRSNQIARFVLAATVVLGISLRAMLQENYMAAFFSGLGVAGLISWHRIREWRLLSEFRTLPLRDQRIDYRFEEEGLRVVTADRNQCLPWPAFTKFAMFDDGVLMFPGLGLVHWIPFRSLEEPSAAAEIEQLLTNKLPIRNDLRVDPHDQ